MGCTEGLARIFVFVSNFAFLLVGLALLVVGILYKVNISKYTDAIPDGYNAIQYVPILTIVVGAIIFLISFMGCCGTLRSNTCMLSWYGGILIIIFLLQVALGIYAFIQVKDKTDLENKITTQLNTVFGNYNNTHSVVDLIQSTFKCCGPESSSFWGNSIPASCRDSSNVVFTDGCASAVTQFFWSSIKTIAIVAIAISVTEVIGAILAFCLTGCIRERQRAGTYY